MTATAIRPVYLLHEGGDTPRMVMCEECIDLTTDPALARSDIIQRHDAGHCMGCDYHAEDFRTNCMDCYEVGRDVGEV